MINFHNKRINPLLLNIIMNFTELCSLVESKGTKPGERYFKAQKNVGPMGVSGVKSGIASGGEVAGAESSAGYSSSPVGKVDSFENPQKVDQMKKYLFDTSKGGDGRDNYVLEAENKKRMRNAFALLFNSKDFYSEFKSIFKNYLTLDSISEADEKEWNRLKDEVDARTSATTGLRNDVELYQQQYDEALAAKNAITEIKEHIKSLKTAKSAAKDKEQKTDFQSQIESAEYDIREKEALIKNIGTFNKRLKEAETKLINETEKEMLAKDAFEEIQNKISSVTENNKKSNDVVIRLVKKLINNKADGLLDRYQIEYDVSDEEIDSKDVDFANVPKDLPSKLKLLRELTGEDNPIFAFIDQHEESFADRMSNFDERLLNKNINIGAMRMHEKLPAVILHKYFNTIAGRGMERKAIPLENLDVSQKHKSVNDIINKLESINTKDEWLKNQEALTKMVDKLPFNEMSLDILKRRIKSFWEVNRRGVSIAKQLVHQIQTMSKEQSQNLKESFDEFAAMYASSFEYDENDFLIDLMEIRSYIKK